MRITGGIYRGRTVDCPPGEIRPAMDRMRESVFSIIGDLEGLGFLDLFAGSGVMALEAASRGASRILCVEKDRGKREVILKNLSILETDTVQARVIISPVERFILRCGERFDIVFLDPPFQYGFKVDLIERISHSGILEPTGTLLIHAPREDALPDEIHTLNRTDLRRYGRSELSWYRFKG